jgi:hypothetical protein
MKIFDFEFKFNGFDIWHKGNQGAGSGLDADTLDTKQASDFQQLTNGGAYGIFPSTASTMVGNEYNLLLNAHTRSGLTITQSGTGLLSSPNTLFDGTVVATYSTDGINPTNPYVLLITGLPNTHTQTGGVLGWSSRYWYPSKYKIEVYDSYNSIGWKTIVDQSVIDKPTKDLLIPIYPTYSGSFTQIKITIYESTVGAQGANGYNKWGLSELFFCHPEAMRVHQYLHVDSADRLETPRNINGVPFDGQSDITITANPNTHTHTIANVTSLQTALDSKAPSGFGLGTVATTATVDWNNYVTTGFFMGTGLLNECEGGSWRFCMVIRHNDSYVSQTMWDFNGTRMCQRNKVNGTWTTWRRLDVTKLSELENDIGAGGTGGYPKITTSSTAPSSPAIADIWWKLL